MLLIHTGTKLSRLNIVKYKIKYEKVCKVTFSSVSSMVSSLSLSLPPFLRILSQNVASNSALELPATVLLQNTSKASFKAYWTTKRTKKLFRQFDKTKVKRIRVASLSQTLWNDVWFWKQFLTYSIYLSCSSIIFLMRTWRPHH